jgi:hypothetical protein
MTIDSNDRFLTSASTAWSANLKGSRKVLGSMDEDMKENSAMAILAAVR